MVEQGHLQNRFQQKLDEFKQTYPNEPLEGGLIHVTAGEPGTVWDALKMQIDHLVSKAAKNGTSITPDELVDDLFEAPKDGNLTAEIVIGRLQG